MAQRKGTVFTVLLGVFLAILLGALLAVVGSDSVAIAAAAPSAFSTQSECENAVLGGVYKVYTPKDFRSHTKNPVDGVKSVAAPTEFVACVLMDTTRGKKYVVQEPGTLLRYRVAEDGSLIQPPYARHDCGNKVYAISYPQEVVPDQPKVPAQKADTAKYPAKLSKAAQDLVPIRDVCAERRMFGERFTNRLDEYGKPYCHYDTPWYQVLYESKFVQYPVNTAAGAGVGYVKGGEVGALIGAFSGGGGTYAARRIAGEGNEEWGWVGLPVGVVGGFAGGALVDLFREDPSVGSVLTGPSSGGTGIGEVISSGGGGIP